VVTLRLVVSALLLLALCRPRVRGYSPAAWALVSCFGLALGSMNALFYQAIERIPLGPAVTIEVLGPLVLSVLASRRATSLLWAALALAGVVLLSGGGFERLDPVGVAFALGAATMWAAYILLGSRTSERFPRADGVAIAMGVAAVVSLPIGAASTGVALLEPAVLALGAVVAVLSSALPYTLELFALRRLPAATFAVLMSLAPGIAATAGYLVLDQALTPAELLAIGLVVAASAGAVLTSRPKLPSAIP
jgi:inner membrane transporter RhtA